MAARLNTDKKQTNETIFNPDSKVERSIRVLKQNQISQNSSNQAPTTVERNVPQESARSDDGKQSNDENKKTEELTNFEVSSKTITTVSGGYGVDNISVAVLINRASLAAALGEKAGPEAIERAVGEIEQLVASAAGAHRERGDIIKISAVDFVDSTHDLEPQPPPSISELLLRQSGTVLNAATILLATLLLVGFGLRPAARAIFASQSKSSDASEDLASLAALADLGSEEETRTQLSPWNDAEDVDLIEDLTSAPRRTPQKRLEQIVAYDEEQAAAVLKQWMRQ